MSNLSMKVERHTQSTSKKLNRRKKMKDSQKVYRNPCFLRKRKEVASIERWPRDWEKEKKKNPCLLRIRTVAVFGRMEEDKSNPVKEAIKGKSEKDTEYKNPCILRPITPGMARKLEKNTDNI